MNLCLLVCLNRSRRDLYAEFSLSLGHLSSFLDKGSVNPLKVQLQQLNSMRYTELIFFLKRTISDIGLFISLFTFVLY